MNTTLEMDEIKLVDGDHSKRELASIREEKGYTIEYVANKLHLRVRIIELIENGDFHLLPEPVFIKGYLRAYAKLLDVDPNPFIELFDNTYKYEKKSERALWQSKKETYKAEHIIRWVTILFALVVVIAVGLWWQKSKDIQQLVPASDKVSDISSEVNASEIKLTDLSKMQSLLAPGSSMSTLEKSGG